MPASKRFKREARREVRRLRAQRTTEAGEARVLLNKVSALLQDARKVDGRIGQMGDLINRSNIDPDDKRLARKSLWNAGDEAQDMLTQIKNALSFLQKAEQNE